MRMNLVEQIWGRMWCSRCRVGGGTAGVGAEVVQQVWGWRWYSRCEVRIGTAGVSVEVVQQVWRRRWYSRCGGGGTLESGTAGVGADVV